MGEADQFRIGDPLAAYRPRTGPEPCRGRCNGLGETVDIFPTLLELCGLSPLPLSDGHSFAPLLSDPTKPWKQAVFHVFDRTHKWMGITN